MTVCGCDCYIYDIVYGRYGLLVRRGESYGERGGKEKEEEGGGWKMLILTLLAIVGFLALICSMLLLLYYFYYPMGQSHDSHTLVT